MVGSAFVQGRVLLVEQPGAWGHAGLRESDFDPQVAVALEDRAANAGLRVLAIRRHGRTPLHAQRAWAILDSSPGSESVRWSTFVTDHELLDVPLDAASGAREDTPHQMDNAPLYLVCAHSKRDTCCAVRGRPLAAALDALRPGRVWECSHTGGHRYAANVLVAPAGLLYGRVLPLAAPELVAAAEADEVIAGLLRGRIGLPPVAQAAVAFAYEHLGLRARGAVEVVSTGSTAARPDGTGDDANTSLETVRVATPHGLSDVLVRVGVESSDGLSCADPVVKTYPSFGFVRITPVA